MKSIFLALAVACALQCSGCFSMMAKPFQAMSEMSTVPPLLPAIANADTTEVLRLMDSSAGIINRPVFMEMVLPLYSVPNAWMTEWLVAHGADMNARTDDGSNILALIAKRENDASDILNVLISHGALVNNKTLKGYESRAQRRRDIAMSASTAGRYGNPGNRTAQSYAPVHESSRNGVDIGEFGLIGATPLHVAAIYGVPANVLTLVEHGAAVNETEGDDKLTPLHVACIMANLDAAKILVEHGANINAKDDDDETPLKALLESDTKKDKAPLTAYLRAHGGTE